MARAAATLQLYPGASRPMRTEDEARLLAKVVLEQFMEGLPRETPRWVCCHQPGGLEIVFTLAEDQLAARVEEAEGLANCPAGSLPCHHRGGSSLAPPQLQSTNLFLLILPPQVPGVNSTVHEPQRAAQTPGQECWTYRQLGHLRQEYRLMEVGLVFSFAGAPAPTPPSK